MKAFSAILSGWMLASAATNVAVIVNVLPLPIEISNFSENVVLYFPYDMDGNGTTDFTFTTTYSDVGLRTELVNRLVIRLDPPPNIGGPVASLGVGYPIGINLSGTNVAWSSSDFIDGFVSPGKIVATGIIQVSFSGHNTQFSERSAIGVEFHAEDGVHYGYFDVSPFSRVAPRITLHGWAWETVPGKAIVAAQVPEASTSILVAITLCTLLAKRTRW